jgi:fermentation-respiration switch protein FrsA (DUF1100 family)
MRLALLVVLAIVALVVLVRLIEPRLAFFPTSGETVTPRDWGVDYEPMTVQTADGERLAGWLLSARDPRAFVVYFHGNGGNLSIWAPILVGLAQRGYSVFAIDYRGYGLSTGRPTERGLYRDVDGVLARLDGFPTGARPLLYWGRSLGATMAAYAASRRPPDGLILESGFPDARSLLRGSPPLALLGLFASYRFSTIGFLEGVKAPILVMHGDADSVVPYEHGRALFARIGGPKQFVTIRGGDHNDDSLTDARTYWDAVDRFVGQFE